MKTKSDVSLPQRGQEMSLGDRISFVPSSNSRCPPSSFLLQQYSPYTAGFYCILKFIIGSLDRPKRFKYSFTQSQCLDLERQFLGQNVKRIRNIGYRCMIYAQLHQTTYTPSPTVVVFVFLLLNMSLLLFCIFAFFYSIKPKR